MPLRYSLNSHCFEVYWLCHNHTRMPFSLLILASNSSKRIMCTKILSIDCKQSETVDNCVSILLFPRLCIATCRHQDVTIENFLSLASCLRSSAIIGNWSGTNVKGVSIYANCLSSSSGKVLAIV